MAEWYARFSRTRRTSVLVLFVVVNGGAQWSGVEWRRERDRERALGEVGWGCEGDVRGSRVGRDGISDFMWRPENEYALGTAQPGEREMHKGKEEEGEGEDKLRVSFAYSTVIARVRQYS
jgi:hypothetical protein